MSITAGSRVGVYVVGDLLGEGGMGAVYRAHDSRLERDVALKVIRPDLAADPDRALRFDREARLLASLNHPHIATVHGLEQAGDVRVLVLELVSGETLAERLRAGPLPVREALGYALQIASGIEAAHDRGIVHRDLKPANIKITQSGAVKILDFGLAKALSVGSATDPSASSPTLTRDGTAAGVVLGTAAYMSPEQARGRRSIAYRYLGVRMRAVRHAHRQHAFRGRDPLRYDRSHPHTRAGLVATAARYAARDGAAVAPVSAEGHLPQVARHR